jgi:hypothetical protein
MKTRIDGIHLVQVSAALRCVQQPPPAWTAACGTGVQTTDFFYPLVDDPYVQGRIAAANVLSDLYAMGVAHCDNVLMLLGKREAAAVGPRLAPIRFVPLLHGPACARVKPGHDCGAAAGHYPADDGRVPR